MSSILNASASGGLVSQGDASATLELQSDGTTKFTVAPTGAYGTLLRTAAQVIGTSGVSTSFDFTGIPSWAKRITVMYGNINSSGTSAKLIQLGDSGGIEYTGYLGTASWGSASLVSSALSSGILLSGGGSDTTNAITHGNVIITNINSNEWTFSGTGGFSNLASIMMVGGYKSLSATLDRIKFTTVNGTDTFDAGSTVNILIEG